MLPLLFMLTPLALDPCLVAEGPQIQARDLAPQVTAFAKLAPETVLATSPNFGVRRDISSHTLRLWAASHSLPQSEFNPVCIFRRAAVADDFQWESEIRQALKQMFGLQLKAGEIQILEQRLSPGPKGRIALRRNGLSYDRDRKRYLWQGRVEGPSGFATLRVAFTMHHTQWRFVAARNLQAGKQVEISDLEKVSEPWNPTDSKDSEASIEFEGRILRRSLSKGSILQAIHLTEAPLIRPGDSVELISQAGHAKIRTQAVAKGKARLGEPLLVATMDGKRLLRAVAIARGEVEIRSGATRKEQ